MAKEKICGIYCIENLINQKKYIGQSIDIKRRWMQHKQQNMIARDTFLYNSIKKHGINSFKFYILEECEENMLNEREIFWISYYDAFHKGYNMTLGGAGTNTGERPYAQNVLPKNFKKNISNKIDDVVPIVKLDLDFNILEIYESVQECARKNEIIATNISKVARQIHKTCNGYVYLKFDDIKDMTKTEIKNYVFNLRNALDFSEVHSTKSKSVALIDGNGIIHNIFKNINEAGKQLNIDPSSITKVCKGRLKTTKGYKFRYVWDNQTTKRRFCNYLSG